MWLKPNVQNIAYAVQENTIEESRLVMKEITKY